jgi:hypothetical protein
MLAVIISIIIFDYAAMPMFTMVSLAARDKKTGFRLLTPPRRFATPSPRHCRHAAASASAMPTFADFRAADATLFARCRFRALLPIPC